ncbi:50S ribosomal protein L15 [Candidatus Woesearchaeota archaeon]|nr:50S ribosomal protein L15 [Candidatus Woesearchaeota archaeon]
MVTNKNKKFTKYRAHTTHGGGHRKKRRGAGNRGGRGNAGSGKRGKANKQSHPKLGTQGFVPRGSASAIKKRAAKTINLTSLQLLIENKKITEKDGIINLTAQGYQKILGTGTIKSKLTIKVKQFSNSAEEKIKAAGGSILSEEVITETKATESEDKSEE